MAGIDRLVTSVARILGRKEKKVISFATGFFFEYAEGLYLITNRHVVADEEDGCLPDELILRLHTNPKNIRENDDYPIPLYDSSRNPLWLENTDNGAEIDLVAISLDADQIRSRFAVAPFNHNNLVPPNIQIPIGQDVLVMGYPKGFHDYQNNLPLIRNALISSIYPIYFEGRPFFLIDSHLHEGMSGSPVLTKPSNISHGTDGSLNIFGGSGKMHLIGVNSAIVDIDKADEDKEGALGLNAVWYAKLIPEIITQ